MSEMTAKRVLATMSGGIDSSVAAALLKEAGFEVIGITMKVWDGKTLPGKGARHSCYGPGEEEDVENAGKIAQILGIPFHAFDLREEYRIEVLDYFHREYLSGRTPNPCVRCNRRVKFGALLEKAKDSGLAFDYIASGHYVRTEYDEVNRRYLLKKGMDAKKDQSYFLFSLSQKQLGCLIFPLGGYAKEDIRRMAVSFGLDLADRPESQDFIAGGYSALVKAAAKQGPILDRRGNLLGRHRGIPFYTIGQRKGLGISSKERLYVTAIDREKNAVIVGGKEDVYGDEFTVSELNWIAIGGLTQPIEVKAKIRYHHNESEAQVTHLGKDSVRVKFKEPQMAITPGQAVVFYDDDIVVGGGTIVTEGGP
jgi:tRNA (5-methylaminomethyl-2-thiouridylate)-methyltransferase